MKLSKATGIADGMLLLQNVFAVVSNDFQSSCGKGGLAGRAIRLSARRASCMKKGKALNSKYGELRYVYMKELKLKLWIYQKFAAFFNISAHRPTLSRFHGRV